MADERATAAVLNYAECHEEVTRDGEVCPCEKPSVAVRLDPEEGTPYPVCAYHSRADMVPLGAVLAALAPPGDDAARALDEVERRRATHRSEPVAAENWEGFAPADRWWREALAEVRAALAADGAEAGR